MDYLTGLVAKRPPGSAKQLDTERESPFQLWLTFFLESEPDTRADTWKAWAKYRRYKLFKQGDQDRPDRFARFWSCHPDPEVSKLIQFNVRRTGLVERRGGMTPSHAFRDACQHIAHLLIEWEVDLTQKGWQGYLNTIVPLEVSRYLQRGRSPVELTDWDIRQGRAPYSMSLDQNPGLVDKADDHTSKHDILQGFARLPAEEVLDEDSLFSDE